MLTPLRSTRSRISFHFSISRNTLRYLPGSYQPHANKIPRVAHGCFASRPPFTCLQDFCVSVKVEEPGTHNEYTRECRKHKEVKPYREVIGRAERCSDNVRTVGKRRQRDERSAPRGRLCQRQGTPYCAVQNLAGGCFVASFMILPGGVVGRTISRHKL